MADAAAAQVLGSAAPGQFQDVSQQLGKMGAKFDNLASLKQDLQLSQGIGINDNSITDPLAMEVKEKLSNYQKKAFGEPANRPTIGNAAKTDFRLAVSKGDSGKQFKLISYADKIDTNNLNTGYWRSTWTVTGKSSTEAQLEGTVELHTYTFEEGNTQLQLSKKFDATTVTDKSVQGKDDPSLSTAIVVKIVEWEHEILSLLKGLQDLSENSLRKIRRVLPITKTKMKWEAEAQRGVKHLKKTAKR